MVEEHGDMEEEDMYMHITRSATIAVVITILIVTGVVLEEFHGKLL